ncbi:PEP-CTERM sorting domain-containing protein [Paludibaculum fermentans]|uniref:PEP-CTERM sorting domain-containing protein n=1 Tax=Paludibaculum fermentans TaxID=1473598 RepID=A0A7S7SMF2_PALFE|nr:PEP-CTERM sorting domain-containing protein [Paludibaculum fermentans]QOY91207.1 PEP-CTERM sorting domain-containing protein [Paludibaculum fermentans]
MKTLILLLGGALTTWAGPLLYTIGADANGVPNQLTMLDVAAQTVTPLATLGIGNTSFAGGLVFVTVNGPLLSFIGVESDSLGDASLRGFYSDGTFGSPQTPIGAGQFGGIVYDGTTSIVRNDLLGASTLESVPPASLVSLGFGFNGGATDSPGGLYLLGNDSFGVSSLYWFDPSTQTAIAQPIALGSGFYGGLAWDSGSSRLYAIQNDGRGGSALWSFLASDSSPTFEYELGGPYGFAALTAGPASPAAPGPSEVPEPSSLLLCATALAAALVIRRK